MLQVSRNHSLTLVEFKEKTADVLGPPILDEAVNNRYVEFTQEWLGEAEGCASEGGVDGFDVAVQIWKKAVKIWGRRGEKTLEKRVLDVVSYECRAGCTGVTRQRGVICYRTWRRNTSSTSTAGIFFIFGTWITSGRPNRTCRPSFICFTVTRSRYTQSAPT